MRIAILVGAALTTAALNAQATPLELITEGGAQGSAIARVEPVGLEGIRLNTPIVQDHPPAEVLPGYYFPPDLPPFPPVPEPTAVLLLSPALAGLWLMRRR